MRCRTLRFLLVALLGSLVAVALPSGAEAGVIIEAGSRLYYFDIASVNPSGEAEENSLSITFESGEYVFTDAGAVITTGADPVSRCDYTTSSHTVRCAAIQGDQVLVDTGALDDSVETSIPVETAISGGSGDDTITATGSQDVRLSGCSGSDVLVGSDGFSVLFGDGECLLDRGDIPGNDVLIGKGADDAFFAGGGDDVIQAGAGNDTLLGDQNAGAEGAPGDDSLQGGEGDDLIIGGGGQDRLFGDEGVDLLAGGAGDDRIFGGDGNDTLGVTVALSEAVISREGGDDVMEGGAGDDVLNGGPGRFVFNRGARFNPIESVDEAAPNGSDTLLGGDGTDTVTYANRVPAVSVTIDGAANDGSAGEHDTVGQDIEAVNGGSGNDVLRAGSLGITMDGAQGNDLLVGGRSDDTLSGGDDDDGRDTLIGGSGKDKLAGGGAEDSLRGDGGDDRIDGGSGSDYIDGGDGADDLRGDSGADIMRSRGVGADTDRCGRGLDFVITGRKTTVGGDCERTDRRGSGTSLKRTTFMLRPVAGTSMFAPPLMFNSAPLVDTVNMPFDSQIDLGTQGTVAIGVPEHVRKASLGATVREGSFVVSRGRGKTDVELHLQGGSRSACSRQAARPIATLRINAKRRFGVIGKRSESVGRRAAWVTEERCAGTLTRVRSGKVAVVDFRRQRRIAVAAGHSYLARGSQL